VCERAMRGQPLQVTRAVICSVIGKPIQSASPAAIRWCPAPLRRAAQRGVSTYPLQQAGRAGPLMPPAQPLLPPAAEQQQLPPPPREEAAGTLLAKRSSGGADAATEPARKRQKAKGRGSYKHLCNEFEGSGSCKFADACTFAHGEAELKPSCRMPELTPARLLLQQRVAQAPPAAASGRGATIPDPIQRSFTEMFWVSPRDPVATPLFQNHMALQQNGCILVPEVEQHPCRDEDQYINMHRNELCMVGIASSHSMFAGGRQVTGVSFSHDCSGMSGKKKKVCQQFRDINVAPRPLPARYTPCTHGGSYRERYGRV
jgi:hypothetical protein